MSRFSLLFSRLALFMAMMVSAFSPLAASPAAAQNVFFSCWCQNTETRTCNHHQIDSEIPSTDPIWASAGLALASAGSNPFVSAVNAWLATEMSVERLMSDYPDLNTRLREKAAACRERCSADGAGFRAFHFETGYREEICEECNSSPESSCTEDRGGRLAFGEARKDELIAQCEDRKAATALLPVRLAIPIGGVSQVQGLPEYINVAYRYMVTVVLVVAIVMVVYGGFRYLVGASLGDIQAGKKIIQDAIVGMLIVLAAYTILSTINPATTILSFTPPEPIECRDLALSEEVKNARCANDTECAPGTRCVEGKNYMFSVKNVVDATTAGAEEGAVVGRTLIGSGKAAGLLGLVSHPLGIVSLLTETREERRARGEGVASAIGAVGGGTFARDAAITEELERSYTNIRVCSTGEQGAPCLETTSCQAPAVCIESWSLCWTGSGNAPGMPCDTNEQCANRHCDIVNPVIGSCDDTGCHEVADPNLPYKVCRIEVRDSTPCTYPAGGSTVFPVQCGGFSHPEFEFTCAFCPATANEEGARLWVPVPPGMPIEGQCKPRTAVGTSCVR